MLGGDNMALLVGYGEKIISPPLGTDLTGFGFYLDRRTDRILDDLKARALFLKDSSQTLLLIVCDLLGLTVPFSDKVRQWIAHELGIPRQNVLLACTHTHSGPAAQPLAGLGVVNHAYIEGLPDAISQAAAMAAASPQPAEFGCQVEAVEPIGYNRRNRDFGEIDPWLKVAIFKQKDQKIYLLNYACHAVTLGPTKEVTADWLGALVAEVEKTGNRAVVFQGYCGDIDPVCYMNRRLGATADDFKLSARILAERAFKAEKYATLAETARLRAIETRIRLPLQVFPKKNLDKETEAAYEATKEFARSREVVQAWRKRVVKNHDAYLKSPWMEDVPIQAIGIGDLRILGLPGEIFSGYGVKLAAKWPRLMTFGYANGNIGYLPSRKAFSTPNDYACYCAPKFYALFAFAPETESVMLKAAEELLKRL
jgi:neutral ceramidase